MYVLYGISNISGEYLMFCRELCKQIRRIVLQRAELHVCCTKYTLTVDLLYVFCRPIEVDGDCVC